MQDGPSDAEAITASLEEPERFEVVFDRHYDTIRRYLQRRCGEHAGEEIAAETFVVAFDRRHTFDTGYRTARPWLLGIATNLLRHHYRAERARLTAYAKTAPEREGADLDDDALAAAAAAPMIAKALAKLSRGDRDALLLMAFADLSYDEIARALGVPVGTVRSRIHRARIQLRERLPGLAAILGVSDLPPGS